MIEYIKKLISNDSDASFKRGVGFYTFLILAFAFLLDLFFDVKVNENILNVMENIFMYCVAGNVIEKFTKKT